MSLKNLSVRNKIPNQYKIKFDNQRVNQIYRKFKNSFKIDKDFIVAVSGGPDSLALAFLTKIFAFKNNVNARYFIVDHKLRKESTTEAIKVKKILKSINIQSKILTVENKKPQNGIQSFARKKRYDLLFSKCKTLKINNLVLGHHMDDLIENFFLRMVRGSGLKGLVSLGEVTRIHDINLLRPLIKFDKKDLLFISKFVFNFYVDDPSNYNTKFNRVKIRNFLDQLKSIGFDDKKFQLTIKNLKNSDDTIRFYVEKNKKINSSLAEKKRVSFKRGFF